MLTESALRDVATVGLALAYGTDRHLTTPEIEAVVSMLHARIPGAAFEEVEAVVAAAAESFGVPGAAEAAADRLRRMPVEVRRAVLADVVALASADGVVQRAEWRFVELVADRWNLPAPSRPASPGRPSPVLTDLAYLALALVYGTDALVDAREAHALHILLAEWATAGNLGDPAMALEAAIVHSGAGRDERALGAATKRTAASLPVDLRSRVLGDLQALADVDGTLGADEERLLARLAEAWT